MAKRVDDFAKKSAQLKSISSNYGVAGGQSGRQRVGDRGWGVLEQCKRTLLSTAVAAGQEDGHIEVRFHHGTDVDSFMDHGTNMDSYVYSRARRCSRKKIFNMSKRSLPLPPLLVTVTFILNESRFSILR